MTSLMRQRAIAIFYPLTKNNKIYFFYIIKWLYRGSERGVSSLTKRHMQPVKYFQAEIRNRRVWLVH